MFYRQSRGPKGLRGEEKGLRIGHCITFFLLPAPYEYLFDNNEN
jgi:hypothetical protein